MTRRTYLAFAAAASAHGQGFRWPEGKRGAVSLTFDDARASQLDNGIPLLNRLGVKATFYLVPSNAQKRAEAWKQAAAAGHELGSHSESHPCTGNYAFSRKNALEEYTPARMEANLDSATASLQRMFGVRPVSFAYPCGQTFIGRGTQASSYIPLVARRFETGRGYLSEAANDPTICDFANLMGTGFDDMDFAAMKKLAAGAAEQGRWLIFVGHDIGARGFQVTDAQALEQFCRYAKDPASGLWLDTVAAIGSYVAKNRAA